MIGADVDPQQALVSFEQRCPNGAFVVAVSGSVDDIQLKSIGPLSCSDGTGMPLVGFGLQQQTGTQFTTALAPDGFTGVTVTATTTIKSVSFSRRDQAYSSTYGELADITSQQGRRQFLTCPNFGVVVGVIGVRTAAGAPVRLGLICSGLPCPVRENSIFGPAGAPQMVGFPAAYLQNSPPPVLTATATQCCSTCTHDFRCQFWVRDGNTGECFLIYRDPQQPGYAIPGDWAYQAVSGFQAGATQPKTSGES